MSVVFQKPGQWSFYFVQHKGTRWPDQGPALIRSSPAVTWAEETRGREDERRANVRCRRKIAGRPGTLTSFFASDMSTGMTEMMPTISGLLHQPAHSLLSLPRCCLQHPPHGSTPGLEECWERSPEGRLTPGDRSLGRGCSFWESTPIPRGLPAHCQAA